MSNLVIQGKMTVVLKNVGISILGRRVNESFWENFVNFVTNSSISLKDSVSSVVLNEKELYVKF